METWPKKREDAGIVQGEISKQIALVSLEGEIANKAVAESIGMPCMGI